MAAKFCMLCLLATLALVSGARPRPRLQQPLDEYDYEPQAQNRAAGDQVVLVSADAYDAIYRTTDRQDDEEYAPRPVHRAPLPSRALKQQEAPKQPPVQTIRNYNKDYYPHRDDEAHAPRDQHRNQFPTRTLNAQEGHKEPVQTIKNFNKVNDDGSFTFGYEAADGSFKEETRGTDCVVRGKYGYIDPDGNKREFTYVSGNPCDPNQPDEEEPEAPADSAERDEPANYPTRPAHRPTTARPPTTYFQNDFRDADEDEVEEEPLQHIRQRVVQRPSIRRPSYQAQQIAITPRPAVQVTTARALPPATTFRPQLLQVTGKPQIQYSQEYSPTPTYAPTPAPAIVTTPRAGQIDFAAEFAKFHREQQHSTTASSLSTQGKSAAITASPAPSGNPLYSTELIYDPSSGSYNTQLYQTLPQTKGELNLNQRLQPYVAQPQQQARPFIPSPQIQSNQGAQNIPLFRHQIQHSNPQEVYQRQQAEAQFQNSAQLFAQQQQLQQNQLQRDRAAARAQAQRLGLQQGAAQPVPQRAQPQFYYVSPRGEAPSSGQIDAFLRGQGIQF